MHCDGCAETIKALLSLEAGVEAVSVSYREGRARVSYDPGARPGLRRFGRAGLYRAHRRLSHPGRSARAAESAGPRRRSAGRGRVVRAVRLGRGRVG
ncbi:MAG: heavy-metal-associated domain-containing protein [Geminicoccales bacterium]